MASTTNQSNAGAEHQWDLMRASFDGDWQGVTTWYGRESAGMDLTRGQSDPAGSMYAISFSDANTGLWHGTGLRFASNGERKFPLQKHNYNLSNNCWHFQDTAGQSSLEMDGSAGRAGHEINFFTSRSRSMIIALYQWQEEYGMVLQSLAATPFRCQRACVDPVRDGPDSQQNLFQAIAGWPGMEQELRPGKWPENAPPKRPIAGFASRSFQKHDVNGYFADNLMCSVPGSLHQGPFDLNFGCMLSAKSFVHLIIEYDEKHQLTRWVERRYQPTMEG
ncbi:hypothetical protein VB734_06855 [Synechococcus sp. BA-124 BA4]|jgi:hypothetical protein|uniref:hypothetical protein n=1 Tax=unclassified Synechococcus TaxID=2626047 RepID=UPI0018CFBBDD|nr:MULTISPECIES: hypothetical protein [unclassified Synechococcus]MEA5399753.1 hypothetical protein [Synechococcus sp. BA-124 BA4]QPN55672.1 hypothetical protein I1E95_10790 [Synechococcus sp. CBW1107]CAK6691153.1 hypothetical protein BBFGKLBO_00966 [Synechococcus sp. CBW1107]